ncbi:MAG: hypothetical protein Q9192_007605 [Flavoplaca navasiana]
MVGFSPLCEHHVMQVISTIALTPNLQSMVQYDFNVGSFAQFGDPWMIPRMDHRTQRTDFGNMSHLAIRQHLDAENFTEDFVLVDAHTEQSHAIWWITATEYSEFMTDLVTGLGVPPVAYPGENFTLWQSHILTQDFPYEYEGISSGGGSMDEIIPRFDFNVPYDPHDPQDPPYTNGQNYSSKEEALYLTIAAYIHATFPEVIYTNDPRITGRNISANAPPWCVSLTPEAAHLSGLLSAAHLSGDAALMEWSAFGIWGTWPPYHSRPPRPGDVIALTLYHDWDNPRWPPPGVAGPFPGPTGPPLPPRIKSSQQCAPRKIRRPRPAPLPMAATA